MKQVARADAKLQGAKDVRAEDSLAGDWRILEILYGSSANR